MHRRAPLWLDPILVEARLVLGIRYSNLGQLAQSVEEYKGAIRFDTGLAGKLPALMPE